MERALLRARLASYFLPEFLLVLLLLLLGLGSKRLRAVTATVPALLAVEALNAAVATSRVHGQSPPRDALGRRARKTVDEHVPHCRLDFLEPEVALAETGWPNVVVVRGDCVQDDVLKSLISDHFSHLFQTHPKLFHLEEVFRIFPVSHLVNG